MLASLKLPKRFLNEFNSIVHGIWDNAEASMSVFSISKASELTLVSQLFRQCIRDSHFEAIF